MYLLCTKRRLFIGFSLYSYISYNIVSLTTRRASRDRLTLQKALR